MERCPNCRARFKGDPVCYRCGCDLSEILRIEKRAQALEQLAVQCLAWDLKAATGLVERTLRLQQRPLALALRGFIEYLAKRRADGVKHTRSEGSEEE